MIVSDVRGIETVVMMCCCVTMLVCTQHTEITTTKQENGYFQAVSNQSLYFVYSAYHVDDGQR